MPYTERQLGYGTKMTRKPNFLMAVIISDQASSTSTSEDCTHRSIHDLFPQVNPGGSRLKCTVVLCFCLILLPLTAKYSAAIDRHFMTGFIDDLSLQKACLFLATHRDHSPIRHGMAEFSCNCLDRTFDLIQSLIGSSNGQDMLLGNQVHSRIFWQPHNFSEYAQDLSLRC